MKDLNDWRKQLKKLNKIILSSLLLTIGTYASDDILSQNKEDILNYSYEKSIQDSSKLEKDWINPITYKYIYKSISKKFNCSISI